MLVAAVIQLQALENGQVRGGFGRAIHSLWHDHLDDVSPAIASQLRHHSQTKPFTLSDLVGPRADSKGTVSVTAGDRAWFRVTTLEASLSAVLNTEWLPRLIGQNKELAGISWSVLPHSTTSEPHPWEGQDSYETLLHRGEVLSRSVDHWRISFRSPTTFRASKQSHLPFPLPSSLLQSWLRRWNAFNNINKEWQPQPHWRHSLLMSSYGLRTVPVRYGRKLWIGCRGWCTLRAKNLDPEDLAIINTLAQYAFFCGSGHHTTQGMGLTRLQH